VQGGLRRNIDFLCDVPDYISVGRNQMICVLKYFRVAGVFILLISSGRFTWAGDRVPIPEDLLLDEHVREEFGINDVTAPSIERIFADLDSLGDLPYEELSRKLPENAPKERAVTALSLGTLIADGLLTVQSEKRGDLKPIGEALKVHAEALGADKRVNRHTKSLVEHSLAGEWTKLKKELAATQSDVEAEMVLLRDVQMANLISLGGWLRAFQIACGALEKEFDTDKAEKVVRIDVIDYYNAEMETLEVDKLSRAKIDLLATDLKTLRSMMDPKADGKYTSAQLKELSRFLCSTLGNILLRDTESSR
jgi:hypothetical protein